MVRDGSDASGSASTLGWYTQVPPTWAWRSNTTALWPSRRSSRAATKPPGPAPITATLHDFNAEIEDDMVQFSTTATKRA